MKLLTKAIIESMPALYSTDGVKLEDKEVIVKFFCPWNNWTWFVFEGNELEDGDWEFFGMVHGNANEMGSFYLSQLSGVTGPLGMKIERDRNPPSRVPTRT